jgi:Na+/H+ antiporter NhaC
MPRYIGYALLAFNGIGAALYLSLASAGWRDPTENGLVPIMGEPYAWAVCLPVLIVLALVDLSWGVSLAIRPRAGSKAIYAASVMVLVCSIAIDFYHH